MDIIRAEIERKRKALADSAVVQPGQKYFKRKDLILKHEEEYLKKHAPEKLAYMKQRDSSESPSSSSSTGGSGSLQKSDHMSRTSSGDQCSSSHMEDLPKLSRREVIRRLRERGEPVTLFGESETDVVNRLRKLEILEPEVNRGMRNDLQAAFEQVDQAYLQEIIKTTKTDSSSTTEPNEKKRLGDVHVQNDKYTYEEVCSMAKETFKNKKDLEGHAKVILLWLKFLLKTWGQQLNESRDEHDKLTVKGKLSSATYTQTVEYMKPLLRKLKSNTLTDDILEALAEIVEFMLDKEYIRANDAYLEMAIGNAPWPIGVTMVGIHARTGREKIFSRNVAHVMNDETQRKYIQGLKRLMTKCQIMFPTCPSKSVEFTPDASVC